MNTAEFDRALSLTRSDPGGLGVLAARLVLVEGLSVNAAANRVGVSRPVAQTAINRLRKAAQLDHCPLCGHAV